MMPVSRYLCIFINVGLVDSNGYAGRLIKTHVITSSSLYEKSEFAKKIRVRVIGAGGGGAGVNNSMSSGSGGGSGAYAEVLFDANELTNSIIVTVGSAGKSAVGTRAGDGGASSFGTYIICPGGYGGGVSGTTGGAADSLSGGGFGADAPTIVGGQIILAAKGGRASMGFNFRSTGANGALGGNGADSVLGSGGSGVISATPNERLNASGYGAGGGGNCYLDADGGNGSPGGCIIEEYA
ncbi:hypothetical protein R0V10_000358 [Escherichia coli]|nr:hypothetical protein [Escherichia coli]EHY3706219.1 hypothetical protein [Escherichia coli]EIN4505399.1 hypothetical protein [Escherichia coli]EKE4303531.1 hypothetical protein [Escherichia coli]EKQ5638574.1 hypothetical protein [Escherichia coli]